LKNRGFTLLETLIAVSLFTVGVIAMVWLFSFGSAGSIDAENTTIAMNLAQMKMEEIKNLAYAGIVDKDKTAVSGFPGFQSEITVTEPETGLKQLVVTVYWTLKGAEVGVPLELYISRN